uniref:Bm4368 n=1 Tax=Setaria digitata TaxID=48799 RepID=A0A915PQM1_9BILA
MSSKSTCDHENDDDDKDEMDVEGALALDLAELEAMLAIDSEQVRYDQQVKRKDFQTGECSQTTATAASHGGSNSQFMIESNSRPRKRQRVSEDEMKNRRKRSSIKSQISKKTASPSLLQTESDELGNTDSLGGDNRYSTFLDASDSIQLEDSVHFNLSSTPASPPHRTSGNSIVFTKPTPPDDVKRRNPRVYSYSPISRTRLTVPKRQFSPEPARKVAKVLIGPRRVTETIRLSDLTKILCSMKIGEFSLPLGFTLKYKKRFVGELNPDTAFMDSLKDDKDPDDISSLQLSSENDVENESKNKTSVVPDVAVNAERTIVFEQKKDEAGTSNSPQQLKRRGRKKLKVNSVRREIFPDDTETIPTLEPVVKDESPTPLNISISKTAKGKPRKRAALIKLKRGKPRKNFTFDIGVTGSAQNFGSLISSSSETSLKDSVREHEDSKVEILDSGMSAVFSGTAIRVQADNSRKMDNIFNVVKEDDYDDGERLHIVEMGDDDDSCDTTYQSFETKKEKDLDNIVTDVVSKLVDQVCDLRSLGGVNLIMEPLRRPNAGVIAEEPRRVPPLRIRIPQKREARQRRPTRVHDYSPPLPVSRLNRLEETIKKRTAIAPTETSGAGGTETRQKRLTRSKESQKKSSLNSKEAEAYPGIRRSSNQKSSVLSSPSCISPTSSLLGSGNEEEVKTAQSATYEGFGNFDDEKSKTQQNQSSLPSGSPQLGCRNSVSDTPFKMEQDYESTGRFTRKRPISYEQLYPSLFSRRRKSSTIKSPATTQTSVVGSGESDGIVQRKNSTEDGDIQLSGSLSLKQRRKRTRHSIADNKHIDDKQQLSSEKLGLDANIYDSEDGKEQISCCPRSNSLTDYDGGSQDGTSKKTLTDIKVEIAGSTTEEVNRSGEKRRLSSSSIQDGRAALYEGSEQDAAMSSTSTRRRRVRLDSEGTTDLSLNLSQSVSVPKSQRRKSSASLDVDAAKPEGNEVPGSTRLRNKRADSKCTSDKTKQKILHRSMPYFKRIAQRRKLNPLAIGLKSRSSDDNPSFFYREILLRGNDLKKEDGGDVIVDVDSELAVEGDDETLAGRSAISVAIEINKIMPRLEMANEDELEAENADQEYLLTLDNIRTLYLLNLKFSTFSDVSFASEVLDRKRLLNDMMAVVSAQYCSEVSSQNVLGGASIRYNTMMKNAHRLRDKIMLFTKDQQENAKWAHQIFLRHLAVPMLATYIDLLRFCKTMGRYLLDVFLEQSTDDKVLNKTNAYIRDFILEKVVDPQTIAISKTLSKRHAKNICLLTVSPTFTHVDYQSKYRSHEYMFRVLLPNVADRVENVRLHLPASEDMSVCEAVDYCIRMVSRKVVEVHRKYPDLKIVLVGWGTSCVINHQVVQCMPNVSAIINFAFPMKTADGPRGDVDDDILLTYCPTLFVIGDQATDCDVRELQIMATRMIAPTGVIVVGSSNCDLYPSTLRLTIERFTHRTVQRALLDDVVDFLQLYCSSSSTSFRLHPLKLVEVNDVDLSVLRTSNLFSNSQTKSSKFGSALKTGGDRRAPDRHIF